MISLFLHISLHIFYKFVHNFFYKIFCLPAAGTCDCNTDDFWSFLLILPSLDFTMDFLTLNFGQLLHLFDNELKNIIRNLKKKKIISAQYGILFNQSCLNEELYPAY